MENTKENKEKFFAQYWGQEVLFDGIDPDYTEPVNSATIYQVFSNLKRESWLQLKPLSKITDEDAIYVCNTILGRLTGRTYVIEKFCSNTSFYCKVKNMSYGVSEKEVGFSGSCAQLRVCDFLRSKGYALPYMGLSVEKLIEYGWIKLK